MRIRLLLPLLAAAVVLPLAGHADPTESLPIMLEETLGQRRYGYPVRLDVPFPQGAVRGPEQLLLEQGGKPVSGVQYDSLTRWPDGSVQWAILSFNRSPGPLEEEQLALRYGGGATHRDAGAGVVEESPEGYVIRKTYRIPKSEEGFVSSVRYGKEELRGSGTWKLEGSDLHENVTKRKSRIIAPGPVNVIIERTGVLESAGGDVVPYRLTLAQPNSKSWLDIAVDLQKPLAKASTLELSVPYLVEKTPARYDFGVGGWVYGTLRSGQQALLTAGGGKWKLSHAEAGGAASPIAAASSDQPRAEGWGHLIDGGSGGLAVAFGAPGFGQAAGSEPDLFSVGANGELRYRHPVPAGRPGHARLLVHHVGDPVHVTAVTSPSAMLHPLKATLPSDWYARCRVDAVPGE